MRTGSDELLKKLAAEKNQYKREDKAADDPLDIPCPKCSELPDGQTCSPVMYLDSHAICDYWFNVQKMKPPK